MRRKDQDNLGLVTLLNCESQIKIKGDKSIVTERMQIIRIKPRCH